MSTMDVQSTLLWSAATDSQSVGLVSQALKSCLHASFEGQAWSTNRTGASCPPTPQHDTLYNNQVKIGNDRNHQQKTLPVAK